MNFEVGKRYPLTSEIAYQVLKAGWPLTSGVPDISRGRLFLGNNKWKFWLANGHSIQFEIGPAMIVSQSKIPDPDRPEPL